MIKVVLFDFHNTLATCDEWLELEIKTLPVQVLRRLAQEGRLVRVSRSKEEEASALFSALRQRVRETGVEISAVEGVARVFEEMGISAPRPEVEEAVAGQENALLPGVQQIDGAGEVLSYLRSRGYRMGVVSSAGYPPFVEMALEKLGLRAFFSEVVTSAGEGIYKSNPEIYLRAVDRLAALPNEAVHIGDHAAFDVQAAGRAGLHTVWFAGTAQKTAELHGKPWEEALEEGRSAGATIMHLRELPAVIANLGRRVS